MRALSKWTALAFGVVLAIVVAAPASAAIPQNACDKQAVAQGGEIAVTADSKNPQRGWQREGRPIKVTLDAANLPKSHAVVCFRWLLANPKVAGANAYSQWLQSSTVTPIEPKPDTPVTFSAQVPPLIQRLPAPGRPEFVGRDKPAGVYGGNNAYAKAEVAILLFDSGDQPQLAFHSSIGVIAADNYCDIPGLATTADSGVASLGAHKNWQPVNGEFDFNVATSKPIPPDALIKVCFRWKLTRGDPGRFFEGGNIHLLEPANDRTLKIAATVPEIPCRPSRFLSTPASDACPNPSDRVADYAVLGMAVPRADARILVFDSDQSPLVDLVTTVGITQFPFAIAIVVLVIASIFFILWSVCRKRLPDIARAKPFLCLITTRRGYASLSQFQITLWTLVVLASSVYVIALSGDLIDITTGTLVLLGISGGATVAAKIKSESDEAKEVTVPDPVSAAEQVAIAKFDVDRLNEKVQHAATPPAIEDANADLQEARAVLNQAQAMAALADATATAVRARGALAAAPDDATKATAMTAVQDADKAVADKRRALAMASAEAVKARRIRHPLLSDLVMEEVYGREIDVTRVQMLCFTLVTAIFVGLSVLANFVIPEIPSGYLILMGISNGVYVGSKYSTRS
jgi:hypothetical protein